MLFVWVAASNDIFFFAFYLSRLSRTVRASMVNVESISWCLHPPLPFVSKKPFWLCFSLVLATSCPIFLHFARNHTNVKNKLSPNIKLTREIESTRCVTLIAIRKLVKFKFDVWYLSLTACVSVCVCVCCFLPVSTQCLTFIRSTPPSLLLHFHLFL